MVKLWEEELIFRDDIWILFIIGCLLIGLQVYNNNYKVISTCSIIFRMTVFGYFSVRDEPFCHSALLSSLQLIPGRYE